MDLDLISILPLQRSLHEIPRGKARFDLDIRTILNAGETPRRDQGHGRQGTSR